jgi:hypothetical protein
MEGVDLALDLVIEGLRRRWDSDKVDTCVSHSETQLPVDSLESYSRSLHNKMSTAESKAV